MCGAETWIRRNVDQKRAEIFEMLCWSRMKISWTDRVRNSVVLHRDKEDRSILHTKGGNWIGHVLHRNCLLKHVIEGKVEGRM